MTHHASQPQNGFTLLLSVLIVGIIALGVSISLLVFGTSYGGVAVTGNNTKNAQGLANACAEVALSKLKLSPTYAGNETVTFSTDNTCTIRPVLSPTSTTRTIETEGYSDGVYRRLRVQVSSYDPEIIVSSWQEIASF